MTADPTNATLESHERLTDRLAVVIVRPDQPIPPFEPGQFITVGLPNEEEARPHRRPRLVRRVLSLASSADRRDRLEFLVERVSEGRLTPRLWALRPGDRLWLDDHAKGSFTLNGLPEDVVVFMIGSVTGLAPFMAMLRTYPSCPPWRHCTLGHVVADPHELAWRDELEHRARADPAFRYQPIEGGPDEARTMLSHWKPDPKEAHVLLCGDPAVIVPLQEDLTATGFTMATADRPGNLHVERYW